LGAIALGLLIPFSILFVLFALDTKIHNRKDIEKEVSDANIIGEIPEVPRAQALLYTNPNERTILAEASRILSANLEFILSKKEKEKEKGHVVLCTSSIQGEGKSFAAMNISLAMASLNKKVLLIGGDLRNPQLHKYLKIDKKKGGLVNYLMDNNYDWKSSVIKGFEDHPTHEVLIAGILPPRPTQLLTNGYFDELIEEAKSTYDYVVIDSAPTLLVTDTLLMAHLADITVYLTRANHTDKKIIAFYKDLKQKGKLKNLAIVINGLGPKNAYGYGYGYKYGYKYGYNYGYSYGYSEKVDRKKIWRNIFKS
jgi:capsular exopolysaccharide synthesis family protein